MSQSQNLFGSQCLALSVGMPCMRTHVTSENVILFTDPARVATRERSCVWLCGRRCASQFGREGLGPPIIASPSDNGSTHIAFAHAAATMHMRLNAAMQMLMPLQKRSMRTVPHVRQVSTSLLRLLTALRSCTSPFPTVRLTCPKPFFVSPVALSAVLQLGLRICVHGDGVTRSGRASRPVLPRQIAQLGRSFEHEHMASRPRPNHWRALRSPCRRCRLRPTICCVCVV